jgi:4-aminobutyrate aminotransferase-like enzyme
MDLIADALAADPRVKQARTLLLQAVADHSSRLNGIKPPDPQRQVAYKELIEQFSTLRGGGLYFPFLGSGIGNGALVELYDGSVKYDFISGIGVHYLGHSHKWMIYAGISATVCDTIMQGNLQQNVQVVGVVETLVNMAKSGGAALEHCFISTSGAMANENALKLMFHKKRGATRVLAFEHCFCGRTMVLSQITDKPQYRVGLPKVLEVDYVPFFDHTQPEQSTRRAVETLRAHLAAHPGQHAGMCLELILGEGGYWVGSRDFFLALIGVLRQEKLAVWIDEVQTFGRTYRPFAFSHFGLDELVDIVTIGKLTQVCATLFRPEFKPEPGLLSQTFTASTASILAAQTILDWMNQGDLFGPAGRIARMRQIMVDRLEGIARRHPGWISGPFGLGALIAFTPFDGREAVVRNLLRRLFDNGVIAFYAGSNPSRIRFLMPIGAVTEEDIQNVCGILESTMAQVEPGITGDKT